MKVIQAGLEDLEALTGLFDDYRQFYHQPGNWAGARQFLQERLERNESAIFLARKELQPLGFTQLYPSFSSTRMARWWILNDLYVTPKARGHGVGEALLEAAVAFARMGGAAGLQLETAHSNRAAQQLYERCGWQADLEYRTYTYRL
ncbi:GNAT family N-acetyltransferase [uncultured Meiothermus sp.]|uniref:GNAT family N-acetyltransferase n=1 Tax=uncultured Meiothermus sp. TaxID=157471 RepID=UPI0026193092|nr:GNAT family N-acetyltransferase [uncultured Meiothermus sp.]